MLNTSGVIGPRANRSSWWQRAITLGVRVLLAGLVALTALVVLVPKLVGGQNFTVLSGSMAPRINAGDIVVTAGVDAQKVSQLRIGEIITFLPWPDDSTVVTHRIVGKGANQRGTYFTTQGDGNDAADAWNPVYDYQIRGKVLYRIPKLGLLRTSVAPHQTWVVPLVAGVLFTYAAANLALSFRKNGSKTQSEPEALK